MRRPRPDYSPSVQGVQGRRTPPPGAKAQSQHSGGCRRGEPSCGYRRKASPGSAGGPPGDLYVVLKVAEHPIFERSEFDLHCTVPINIAQAALGASVDLLTFDGIQTVKIPEGSQPGARVRLKGLGVPRVNAQRARRPIRTSRREGASPNSVASSANCSSSSASICLRRTSPSRRASSIKSKTTFCSRGQGIAGAAPAFGILSRDAAFKQSQNVAQGGILRALRERGVFRSREFPSKPSRRRLSTSRWRSLNVDSLSAFPEARLIEHGAKSCLAHRRWPGPGSRGTTPSRA